MQFSCYCQEDEKTMSTISFAFAKQNDMILVELFFFSCFDGNLDEDTCKFVMNIAELKKLPKLNDFYNVSLLVTENLQKLTYHEEGIYVLPEHSWGISHRKHIIGNSFTDDYYNNYGFSEHPSVTFNNILKMSGIHKYNNYCIKYYTRVYENTLKAGNYTSLYIDYEINKIAKEIGIIEKDVQNDIMCSNADILTEILPADIVHNIKSILVL